MTPGGPRLTLGVPRLSSGRWGSPARAERGLAGLGWGELSGAGLSWAETEVNEPGIGLENFSRAGDEGKMTSNGEQGKATSKVNKGKVTSTVMGK